MKNKKVESNILFRPGYQLWVLKGSLDFFSIRSIQEEIKPHLRDKNPVWLLDLGALHSIDSSGIGLVMFLLKELKQRANYSIIIAGLQGQVRHIFEMGRLIDFFTVCETVTEGLAIAEEKANLTT